MEMKKEIKDKVVNTNQKYLEKFLSQDVPEKLEKQLENMDWSYIDMINDKEQKRGTFSPLEAMEISKIESNRSKYTDIGIDAIKKHKSRSNSSSRRTGHTSWIRQGKGNV